MQRQSRCTGLVLIAAVLLAAHLGACGGTGDELEVDEAGAAIAAGPSTEGTWTLECSEHWKLVAENSYSMTYLACGYTLSVPLSTPTWPGCGSVCSVSLSFNVAASNRVTIHSGGKPFFPITLAYRDGIGELHTVDIRALNQVGSMESRRIRINGAAVASIEGLTYGESPAE